MALSMLGACRRLVEEAGPPFAFAPGAAYRLRLGWGDALDGLETIEIAADRTARLVRRTATGWVTAVVALNDAQSAAVTGAIQHWRVPQWLRVYMDPDVNDGEQWLLCLEQSGAVHTSYCSNHGPAERDAFRAALLELVVPAASAWTALPDAQRRDGDRELWHAIDGR